MCRYWRRRWRHHGGILHLSPLVTLQAAGPFSGDLRRSWKRSALPFSQMFSKEFPPAVQMFTSCCGDEMSVWPTLTWTEISKKGVKIPDVRNPDDWFGKLTLPSIIPFLVLSTPWLLSVVSDSYRTVSNAECGLCVSLPASWLCENDRHIWNFCLNGSDSP